MSIRSVRYVMHRRDLALAVFGGFAAVCLWSTQARAACTGASPEWTSSIDNASLADCVSQAAAGDTIHVSAGSATYSSNLVVDKPLEILGAGQDPSGANSSFVTFDGACIQFSATSGVFELAGFRFTGTGGSCGFETVTLFITAPYDDSSGTLTGPMWDAFDVHDITWVDTTNHAVVVGEWFQLPKSPKGVFHHITYTNSSEGRFLKFIGNNLNWKSDDAYGTDDFIFIEDSSFSWSTGAVDSDVTDSEHGGRLVVRHNTITNGDVQVHDTGSTEAAKGQRATEIYDNTWNCTSCSAIPAMGLRGGGYLVHDNTIASGYQNAGGYAYAQIYRVDVGAGFLGQGCDGTAVPACDTPTYYHCSGGDHAPCGFPGDSLCSGKGSCVVAATDSSGCPAGYGFVANLDRVNGGSSSNGWPCRNQTGWGKESADGTLEDPSPVYWWNNQTESGGTTTISNANAWFVQDRDFCYHDPSTACGAKAAWTYTPYVYPHPLSSGVTPPPQDGGTGGSTSGTGGSSSGSGGGGGTGAQGGGQGGSDAGVRSGNGGSSDGSSCACRAAGPNLQSKDLFGLFAALILVTRLRRARRDDRLQ